MELRVWDCPSCGAPLPPAGINTEVTCASCGKATTLTDGSDAIVREQKSRAEAETLFAHLGEAPSWSQRLAAGLANWKVWVFLFPFALGLLWTIGAVPRDWLEAAYEKIFHARLVHVAPPVIAWLVQVSFTLVIALALLVWSLLGERVDARRDLQAMLAAKPPETDGGPARCRKCSAPLEVKHGALGTRCPYCGADNLLVLPPDWVENARKMDSELRLTTKLARERAAVGRRRVIVAAAWRVPLVGLLFWYVTGGALRVHGYASWDELRVSLHGGAPPPMGLYQVAGAEDREHAIRAYSTCANRKFVKEPAFDTQSSNHCDALGCQAWAMFALRKGDKLHLVRATPGDVAVGVSLVPRIFTAGLPTMDDTGELISNAMLADEVVQPIAISGWYQVKLFTRDKTAQVGVVPCIE